MATASLDLAEDFRQFIVSICATDPGSIVADGRWHRFRISDTRHKGSKPGRYLLHLDERPNGLFMDWRDGIRHKWRPDGKYESIDRDEVARRREARRMDQLRGFQIAAEEAFAFWGQCSILSEGLHPYLERKGLQAALGTRQGIGKPFGLGDVPCVIVPLYDGDDKPRSLQAIREDGERRFWPDSTHEGTHHLIGKDNGQSPIVFCEGFSTAASIHAATGFPVVMCVTSANMAAVARWAAHRWPDREKIVAGDDDWHLIEHPKVKRNVGKEAAENAARILGGRVILPNMHGLVTDGGDDFNDMARELGEAEVAALFAEPAALPLAVIDPAMWHGQHVPEREWRVDGFVPQAQATLLTGAGATGKSLASQLLVTCSALGLDFLGIKVTKGPALYITCEDEPDELHRRQAAICRGLSIDLASTSGKLFLLSLYGELGNEICTFDEKRTLQVAPRYNEILETALGLGVKLIVLDNTSHMFTGNENVRSEVAAFANLCNGLARKIGGAVIIVGFPNKAGDSYSGSTAWENQVRSRLFLETPKNEDGVVVDPDYRVLRNEKANYARRGAEVGFVWKEGTFTLASEGKDGAPISHVFTESQAYEALAEVDRRWLAGNPFSAAHNSPDRYLGTWLQARYGMSRAGAASQIKRWTAVEILVSQEVDKHSKKIGLRVVNWPDLPCGSTRK